MILPIPFPRNDAINIHKEDRRKRSETGTSNFTKSWRFSRSTVFGKKQEPRVRLGGQSRVGEEREKEISREAIVVGAARGGDTRPTKRS